MGHGRKGRKANEIPAKELKQIRKRERDYAKRKKAGNVANNAEKVKSQPPLRSDQPITQNANIKDA